MSRFGRSTSGGGGPFHRRMSGENGVHNELGPPELVSSSSHHITGGSTMPLKPAKKGLSVKRQQIMKNPLHSPPPPPPPSLQQRPTRPRAPAPKKQPVADDFFAEMGVVAPKPRIAPAAPRAVAASSAAQKKALGATALSATSDEFGGDDWGDDDLDDLFDD
jgi:hypothetical protein